MGHGREGGGGGKITKISISDKLVFFTSKLSLSKNVYGKYLTPLLAETLFLKWLKFECLHNKKNNNKDYRKKIYYKNFLYTRIFFVQYKNL